jgi:putative ABC transport system permease protein
MFSALRHAWRSWTSARAVGAMAAIAFAVGIGSATAIYTVVNGVMLKPVPYADPDRFVALYGANASQPDRRSSLSVPDLLEYQQQTSSFDAFGWYTPASSSLVFAGQPQHVVRVAVTTPLALSLGVAPRLGQWFHDDQGAVIAHALWRRLGSDPAIVGKPVTLDGRTFTITGVMPPGFRLPVPGPGVESTQAGVWIAFDPSGRRHDQDLAAFFGYARLKPGVPVAQAEADVKRVAAQIAANDPGGHPSYTARLDGLREAIVIEIRPTLLLLVAASLLLLLITCADVAGLLLARSIARARETAIRVALGATRRQLALQYFVEALIVSVAGAAAGIVISLVLVRMVLSIAADYIPRADEVAIDWTVFAFALAAAAAASVLASFAPLWQAIRTVPADVLNDGIRATASARSRRLSHTLVIGEIALAFTLMAVSAALLVHLRQLVWTSPGFNPDNVTSFRLTPARTSDNAAQRTQDQARWLAALESIPGVSSAALSNHLPLEGCCFSTMIYPEGRVPRTDAVEDRVSLVAISPGFMQTLGVPVRRGRLLDARDTNEDPVAIVINEATARAYFPDRNPMGARGRFAGTDGSRFEVVGVVGDVRNDGLGKPTVPEVYLSSALLPPNPMRFVVRSTLPTSTLVPALRRAIQSVDPTQAIHTVATMSDVVQSSVARERVGSLMTTFFALAALLMASLGIYGVVAYGVRQETVEIGTRMALGAIGRELLLLVVGRGLKMAAYGALIGAVALLAGASSIGSTFEVQDLGALPLLASTAIVAIVATTASFFPAWKATQLSPMVAIRNDPRSTRLLLRARLTRALSSALKKPELRPPDSEVLSQLAAAARGASSFDEAFGRAVEMLRTTFHASSVWLLERADDSYRLRAAAPAPSGEAVSLPVDGFLPNRLKFYSFPLAFTPADVDSWMRWAQGNNAAYVPDLARLRQLDARMAVPLRAKTEILGILLLGPSSAGAAYSDGDKQLLRHCAEQLTLMIENARLTTRVVEQEKLRRDLALAAEVQKRLLPAQAPNANGAALSAVSFPARSVGGDYYDFFELGNHRIGIALADIAGKGIAAALIMAVVQASLRIVASDGELSLPELAERMNAFLHRSTGSSSYATFFYAQLDEQNRQLRYVNAGHNPPYLIRSLDTTPDIRELSVGGTVIGLLPHMSYEEAVIDLQAGDVVVAFTDGVIEALNAAEEEYGEERLKNLLRTIVHLPAAEISARVSSELRSWIKDTAQYDDLTVVVMKVT